MSALAMLAPDSEGGFNVIDSRDGQSLAWRSELTSAHELLGYLNRNYPCGTAWPAYDSLVHEIVCFRVGGEVLPLELHVAGCDLSRAFPAFVPVGPGWDHLYSENENPGPDWYRRQA